MAGCIQEVSTVVQWSLRFVTLSGVARILLQGGTGAWRTGSEVRGDKIIQK